AMVYLGLVDDDYDDYEAYDEVQATPPPAPAPAPQQRPVRPYAPPEPAYEPAHTNALRTLPREAPPQPEPQPIPQPVPQPRPPVVRPITPVQTAKVFVVAPSSFNDAKEIGDRLKATQPVIVNLQSADAELVRRLIDFCSGLSYGLAGAMEKVADRVFLLTPSNVEVSAEERRRLQERGLYQA
ncbi:MAG TPA: cell division protein SepF, partial [Acidimicrobiales bacterium]|nr:cell division protein SepF [Acidimicrobiales bacterium]